MVVGALVVAAVVVAAALGARGQTSCAPINTAGLTACSALNYSTPCAPAWVNQINTYVDSAMANRTADPEFWESINVDSPVCLESLGSVLCAHSINECTGATGTCTQVNTQSPICRSSCQQLRADCGMAFSNCYNSTLYVDDSPTCTRNVQSELTCASVSAPLEFCTGIDYPVPTSRGTQAQIDATHTFSDNLAKAQYEDVIGGSDDVTCKTAVKSVICSLYFPNCDPVTNEPLRVCKSLCETVDTECLFLGGLFSDSDYCDDVNLYKQDSTDCTDETFDAAPSLAAPVALAALAAALALHA